MPQPAAANNKGDLLIASLTAVLPDWRERRQRLNQVALSKCLRSRSLGRPMPSWTKATRIGSTQRSNHALPASAC